MREIKFRAWDLIEKEWYKPVLEVYRGELFELVLSMSGHLSARKLVQGVEELWSDCPTSTGFIRYSERFKLMQYTGLKDKNGVEIYEGDILEGHDDGLVKVEWFQTGYTCFFDDDGNGIGLDEMCIWFGNNAEVIGNIYENPELVSSSGDEE